jgi:hypothetical protein
MSTALATVAGESSLTLGDPAKMSAPNMETRYKKGRPRKYASNAERQRAYRRRHGQIRKPGRPRVFCGWRVNCCSANAWRCGRYQQKLRRLGVCAMWELSSVPTAAERAS